MPAPVGVGGAGYSGGGRPAPRIVYGTRSTCCNAHVATLQRRRPRASVFHGCLPLLQMTPPPCIPLGPRAALE
jgi:hypothetical protein